MFERRRGGVEERDIWKTLVGRLGVRLDGRG